MGHNEKRNPVWISTEGNIPEAGSAEANQILGRESAKVDMSKEHGLQHSASRQSRQSQGGFGRTVSRRLSGSGRRPEVSNV